MRGLLLGGALLAVSSFVGLPVLDWVASAASLVYYAAASLVWAFWQLLQPTADATHSTLPELHQAVFNVTRDATRLADLLEDFLRERGAAHPGLREDFLSFLADQASSSYSVVDNKLSWVLWLYSLLWMPLLVIMCLTRSGSSSGRSKARQAQTAPAAAQQLQQQRGQFGGSSLKPYYSEQLPAGVGGAGGASAFAAAGAGGGPALSASGRRRTISASQSLELPARFSVPGSFGRPPRDPSDALDGGSSVRSAATSSRSLRRVVSASAQAAAGGRPSPPRASSDRLHMGRPSSLLQAQRAGYVAGNAAAAAAAGWGPVLRAPGGGGPASSSGSPRAAGRQAGGDVAAGADQREQQAVAALPLTEQQVALLQQQHQSMRPLVKGASAAAAVKQAPGAGNGYAAAADDGEQ